MGFERGRHGPAGGTLRVDNLFVVKYLTPFDVDSATTLPVPFAREPGITLKIGATMRFGG